MATSEFLDEEPKEQQIDIKNMKKTKRRIMDEGPTDYFEQSVQTTKNMEESKKPEGMVDLQTKTSVFFLILFKIV